MAIRISSCIIFLLCTQHLFSQKSTWYFTEGLKMTITDDGGVAIDTFYNPDAPLVLRNQTVISAIGDSSDNLIFYSDGMNAYNSDHRLMLNGDSLGANGSIAQVALICPMPKSDSLFYLFTIGQPIIENDIFRDRLRYSIVDRRLDNGKGGIPAQSKNLPLRDLVSNGTGLLSVSGIDGTLWVIVADNDGFSTYHLSKNGLSQGVEKQHRDLFSERPTIGPFGHLKSSENGKLIAALENVNRRKLYLLSLDPQTGLLYNIGKISDAQRLSEEGAVFTRSLTFSDCSRYLYAFQGVTENNSYRRFIVRYNVESQELVDILSSRKIIVELPADINDMQLSPEDPSTIYVLTGDNIGAIYDTDSETPVYVDSVAALPMYIAHLFFPNPIIYPKPLLRETLSFGVGDTVLCAGDSISFDLPKGKEPLSILVNEQPTESLIFTQSGSYNISITDGYSVFDTTIILQESNLCECNVYIPNTMSMSSTKGNNEFGAYSNCDLINYSMEVYDRWGGQLYSTIDQNNYWNGSTAQSKVQSGVYTYKISYRLSAETEEEIRRGSITVID
jgi:hypothetical protein